MVELSSAVLTTLIGMLGVVIGAIISNYFNNKIAAKSARRDMIFRKKTEYFEKTVECIEKNIKIYKNSAREAEKNAKKEEINRIIHKLRENRAKFDVMASRLYVNSENMAGMIKKFVNIEKMIFLYFEKLKEKEDEAEALRSIRNSLKELDF